MSRSQALSLSAIVLSLAVPACSAIVAPDLGRLGGVDAGPGAPDAPRSDAALTDAPSPTDAPLTPDAPAPECTTPADCDDGVACTTDACGGGTCSNAPDDGACADGERCQAGTGCVPIVCENDGDCDDADACNGDETCAPGASGADPRTGCLDGPAPVCDDGISCTADSCEPATGCRNAPSDVACDDGVGCTMDRCAATAGPSGCENLPVNTICASDPCMVGATCDRTAGCVGGAPRDCRDGNVCTVDSCDPAAAGFCVHVAVDADMDGAPARSVGTTSCSGGTDCNDANPAVRPGIAEVCGNGIDDNCAGGIDEGCATPTGENCATARPLVLSGDPSGTRTARFNGSFSSFADDYLTSCGRDGGHDAVFSLTLDRLSDVRIETNGIPLDTVLAVSAPTCDPAAFTDACNDDFDPGSSNLTSRIWLHRLGPVSAGSTLTVYILVDAWDPSITGMFQLDVSVMPVHPDACGTVEQLDITPGGLVIGATGGVGSVVGGQRGSCDPDTFVDPDAEAGIFRLSAPGDGRLAELTARSMGFSPMIYVRTGSCSPGTEVGCNVGGSLMGTAVSSGTRAWVIVDGVPAGTTGILAYSLLYDP